MLRSGKQHTSPSAHTRECQSGSMLRERQRQRDRDMDEGAGGGGGQAESQTDRQQAERQMVKGITVLLF